MNKVLLFLCFVAASAKAQTIINNGPLVNNGSFYTQIQSSSILTNDTTIQPKALAMEWAMPATNHFIVPNNPQGQQVMLGSTNTPWLVSSASTTGTPASLLLYTGTSVSLNKDGYLGIKAGDGNTLEMAINDKNGIIGWANQNTNSQLTISASMTVLSGRLKIDSLITANSGINVTNSASGLSTVNISASSISFTNNGNSSYVGTDINRDISGTWNESFLINSNYQGGILINSAAKNHNETGLISFSINSEIIGRFMNEGLIVGTGEPDPSAILILSSNRKGLLPPKLSDEEILNIHNPTEGIQVYSTDHHTLAFYNGADWMLITGLTKLNFIGKGKSNSL